MRRYVARDWREALAGRELAELWGLPGEWVEPPNQRRGGWSGVVRARLAGPGGRPAEVYLKRQCNHVHRCWAHPLRGEPTLARELRNLLRCQAAGVAVAEPLYCEVGHLPEGRCAVLITVALADYRPLDEVLAGAADPARGAQRRHVLATLARLLRALHRARLAHGSLYPKHVFVRLDAKGGAAVRLIDLEKGRRRLLAHSAMLRDLDTLNRHTPGLTRSERARFLCRYLDRPRLDHAARRVWRALARRQARKEGT